MVSLNNEMNDLFPLALGILHVHSSVYEWRCTVAV
jgi:hypothetical protein